MNVYEWFIEELDESNYVVPYPECPNATNHEREPREYCYDSDDHRHLWNRSVEGGKS